VDKIDLVYEEQMVIKDSDRYSNMVDDVVPIPPNCSHRFYTIHKTKITFVRKGGVLPQSAASDFLGIFDSIK